MVKKGVHRKIQSEKVAVVEVIAYEYDFSEQNGSESVEVIFSSMTVARQEGL